MDQYQRLEVIAWNTDVQPMLSTLQNATKIPIPCERQFFEVDTRHSFTITVDEFVDMS